LEKSSFFNSVGGDRKYQASDFSNYFKSLITNGVFPNPSTNLQAMSNNAMSVTLKAGKAWINGYIYINDSDLLLPIAVADGTLSRIDRVVVQFSTTGRVINTVIKKGVFSSSPIAPILQRDSDLFELGMADIYITNGATTITQSNITDQRFNTSLCGVVNSLITADTTTLFNQYTDGFNKWFTTIQNALSGDIAGNLAVQIEQIKSDDTYQVATGTATAITIVTATLTNGYSKTFIASANNGSVATTINGKPLYKPGTTTPPNLITGKAYTIWYNSANNCFFIKASAEGTALAGDVLAGKSFSTDIDVNLIGTRAAINIPFATTNISRSTITNDSNPTFTMTGHNFIATRVEVNWNGNCYFGGGSGVNITMATGTDPNFSSFNSGLTNVNGSSYIFSVSIVTNTLGNLVVKINVSNVNGWTGTCTIRAYQTK